MSEEFKEFGGLPDRLKRSDFSGESRVKNTLRQSLLDRAVTRRRRVPAFAWLVPAAAAAALFVMFGPGRKPAAPEAAPSFSAYALPDDGYGACGRMGLEDFQAGERY